VLGIIGVDPSFRHDDGSADPLAAAALVAFAAGQGSEHAALMALAVGRLLVPVVAVPAEQVEQVEQAERGRIGERAGTGERGSEMAMPTLVGLDGRRAVPAFTCIESLQCWQPDARPVPVSARLVWQAAVQDSCAVVVDVAGPVPLAVEGARLAALARGDAAPAPEQDPDVHEAVAEALAGELGVAGSQLGPGDADRDLVIVLTLTADCAKCDARELAARIGNAVMTRLGGRLRRGVAIGLGSPPIEPGSRLAGSAGGHG
jgi:SseB protein N-terminal domain